MDRGVRSDADLFDGINLGAGRESFDVELMYRIDHELINLCQHGMHLSKALRSPCGLDVDVKFGEYREALSSFLAYVKENLYDYFHGKLEGHPLYTDFLEFETETQTIIRRVEKFLRSGDKSISSHKKLFERALCRLDCILVERHEEELAFLAPLQRSVKLGQTVQCLTETQNRVLLL